MRETAAEGGRDDLDRAEYVEGAPDTLRDMAGEGGAGRLGVSAMSPTEGASDGGVWNVGDGGSGIVIGGGFDAWCVPLVCSSGIWVFAAVGVVAEGVEAETEFSWLFIKTWRCRDEAVGVVGDTTGEDGLEPFAADPLTQGIPTSTELLCDVGLDPVLTFMSSSFLKA